MTTTKQSETKQSQATLTIEAQLLPEVIDANKYAILNTLFFDLVEKLNTLGLHPEKASLKFAEHGLDEKTGFYDNQVYERSVSRCDQILDQY